MSKLFRPESISTQLHDMFKAAVARKTATVMEGVNNHRYAAGLEPVTLSTRVVFVENMERVDGLMYHMVVSVQGRLYLDELNDLSRQLEQFCGSEEAPTKVCGYGFVLGDGDDSMAVWFEDGRFRIWLRGWK